jgi:hypothetical protein
MAADIQPVQENGIAARGTAAGAFTAKSAANAGATAANATVVRKISLDITCPSPIDKRHV